MLGHYKIRPQFTRIQRWSDVDQIGTDRYDGKNKMSSLLLFKKIMSKHLQLGNHDDKIEIVVRLYGVRFHHYRKWTIAIHIHTNEQTDVCLPLDKTNHIKLLVGSNIRLHFIIGTPLDHFYNSGWSSFRQLAVLTILVADRKVIPAKPLCTSHCSPSYDFLAYIAPVATSFPKRMHVQRARFLSAFFPHNSMLPKRSL